MSMKENDVMGIIAKALSVSGDNITSDSSADNVEEWDSLGHLGILVALDKAFDGKLASISDMATADSVKKIVKVLKDNSFI